MLVALAPFVFDSPARSQNLAEQEQSALNAAVEAVADSVVQIRTVGGLDQVDEQLLAQGPTTGLIVSENGYIVSSAFNFAQRPTSILVRLPDGEQRPARIVGRDAVRMLVLLKVESDDPLPVPEAAPLDEVRPGDWAVAVGRTFQPERVNMSVGIISALNRMHGRALQTDANVSAANYGGPLVDVRGRVLGVLVPMAPQTGAGETSEAAGAEFYDSGIGFAVPLEHVLESLPRWIEEGELKRGLLGVGLKSGNPHTTPPVLTAVWPNSPAAKAGWRQGDRILAVNGKPVDTQTQLRFHVVPRYAGDKLKVNLRRGDGEDAEVLETEVELVAALEPFRHAFLGVLPNRAPSDNGEGKNKGVAVRAIWPDSPADEAGLQSGDRVTQLEGKDVNSVADAVAALNAHHPGEKLEVTVQRADERLELEVALGELPTAILSASRLAGDAADNSTDEDEQPDALEMKVLKLAEFPQLARYYQPPGKSSPGLIIWLSDGKESSVEALSAAWRSACLRDGLALVIAAPGDAAGWSPDDMEYLLSLAPAAARRLTADPHRIVVAGEGTAGQMAYALAFKARRWIRGVVTIDSPLPRTLQLPPNGPSERLAVLSIQSPDTPLEILIRRDFAELAEAGYPATKVVRRSASNRDDSLDAITIDKVARWLDGIDRF